MNDLKELLALGRTECAFQLALDEMRAIEAKIVLARRERNQIDLRFTSSHAEDGPTQFFQICSDPAFELSAALIVLVCHLQPPRSAVSTALCPCDAPLSAGNVKSGPSEIGVDQDEPEGKA